MRFVFAGEEVEICEDRHQATVAESVMITFGVLFQVDDFAVGLVGHVKHDLGEAEVAKGRAYLIAPTLGESVNLTGTIDLHVQFIVDSLHVSSESASDGVSGLFGFESGCSDFFEFLLHSSNLFKFLGEICTKD